MEKRSVLFGLTAAAIAGVLMLVMLGAVTGGTATGGASGRVTSMVESVGAKTATFTTSTFNLAEAKVLYMTLDVTAASGTSPTMDCTIQSSSDNSNWYSTGTTFTQATGVTSESKSITTGAFHRNVRCSCTIGGTTPSFTSAFYVTGKP